MTKTEPSATGIYSSGEYSRGTKTMENGTYKKTELAPDILDAKIEVISWRGGAYDDDQIWIRLAAGRMCEMTSCLSSMEAQELIAQLESAIAWHEAKS